MVAFLNNVTVFLTIPVLYILYFVVYLEFGFYFPDKVSHIVDITDVYVDIAHESLPLHICISDF